MKKLLDAMPTPTPVVRWTILSIFVIAVTAATFWVAQQPCVDDSLEGYLEKAAVTLIFGAVLGGIVKFLFEDFTRAQEKRVEQARFATALLDDLKAVYDRVERARRLIPAQKSAKTFGEEMRDLIDARVKLLSVRRALRRAPTGLREPKAVETAVETMSEFLQSVIESFEKGYYNISRKQSVYEALKGSKLASLSPGDDPESVKLPDNPAWSAIEDLDVFDKFIKDVPGEDSYTLRFVEPLDEASKSLRLELKQLLR